MVETSIVHFKSGKANESSGEIDIVESVNQADNGDQMTSHTSHNCNMDAKRKQTGNTISKSCWNETDDNAGCRIAGPQNTSGESFNANGGDIYAVEWRDAGIRMWFFYRSSIPTDIPTDPANTTAPDPSAWGRPLADFPNTNCDISSHFKNQSIIVDIDLCGQWAGSKATYKTEDSCPESCTDFVANNAAAFEKAYWQLGRFRVYKAD